MQRTAAFLIVVALAVCGVYSQQGVIPPSQEVIAAMDRITTHGLMSHIRFLSHDLLEGRAPGTRGDVLARTYIAAQMEMLGLEPGGDNGTYFQRVPLVAMRTDPSAVMTLKGKNRSVSLGFGAEFVGFPGVQEKEVSVQDAEIVFVGYGIIAPEQEWNDYKNADVRGKILLMLNNDPAPDDPKVFGGKARTYYGRWTYKYEVAEQVGAAGAIVIHTTESAGYGWNVVESSWSRERYELQTDAQQGGLKLKAWTTFDATKKILDLAGKSFADLERQAQRKSFRPVPLGVTLSTTMYSTIHHVETTNVLGLIRGSDPQLLDQAVIYTAHYDHLGIGKPVDGDSIYNGALDNATGVSAVLNIAAAFTSLPTPPRRTVVIAAVGAEESGLLGSAYYARNPTFPPASIAANINIDGVNIFGRTRDIVMIGLGKSTMDDHLTAAARWQGRVVKPDAFPEQGSFYRSDQFNFAKIGIPCMYARSGLDYIDKPADFGREKVDEYIRKHYHQPSDEIGPDWELSGGVEDSQLQFLVGLSVANSDGMPVWNKGDEFERIRLESLSK
jgi:Zn-dependent M28 family amino/carboxypeptidase